MGVLIPLFLFAPLAANAKQAVPEPPAANPRPAKTAADKAAVAFAEKVVSSLLAEQLALPSPGAPKPGVPEYANKDEACLKTLACVAKDEPFSGELHRIYTELGTVSESKHAHVHSGSVRAEQQAGYELVPLDDDEFVVHSYARFAKRVGWSDVSVVLHRDDKGSLFLRRIVQAPMQAPMRSPQKP